MHTLTLNLSINCIITLILEVYIAKVRVPGYEPQTGTESVKWIILCYRQMCAPVR